LSLDQVNGLSTAQIAALTTTQQAANTYFKSA